MIVNCCHVEIVAFLKLTLSPAAMVNPFISSSSFSAILKDFLHRNHVICKLRHSWYQWFVFFSLSVWLRNLSAYSLSKNEILVWIFSVLLFSISPNFAFYYFLPWTFSSFCCCSYFSAQGMQLFSYLHFYWQMCLVKFLLLVYFYVPLHCLQFFAS